MAGVNIMQESLEYKEDVYLSKLIENDQVIVKPSINEETGAIAFTILQVADGVKIDGTLVIDVPVDKITSFAFNNQDQLTSVVFNTERDANALKEINACAFLDCNNLREFSIPSSVEHLGHGIFAGCNSLTDEYLYYGGSSAEWDKLVANSTKYNDAGETISRWDAGAALPSLHPEMDAFISDEKRAEAIEAISEAVRQAEQQNAHSINDPATKEEVRTLNYGFEEVTRDMSDAVKERAAEMAKIEVAIQSLDKEIEADKAAAKAVELDF